jgi:hypothetical protein
MNPPVIYNREFEALKGGDTGDGLCGRMRTLFAGSMREYAIKPERVVHPDTAPVEIGLPCGSDSLTVIARKDGRLAGMVSAREVLAAPHAGAER